MNRSTDRQGAVTRARVVSLVLIALAVLGLAYLHFAGSDRVSVPKGAHAGDLNLERCTYTTEKGGYDAHCGPFASSLVGWGSTQPKGWWRSSPRSSARRPGR